MARFGRGMIQALTQPAYMGGLMQVAQNIGSAPARQRAAEVAQARKDTLASFDPYCRRSFWFSPVLSKSRGCTKCNETSYRC